jgi:hypothetical protein
MMHNTERVFAGGQTGIRTLLRRIFPGEDFAPTRRRESTSAALINLWSKP